jgi:outer membrane protein assembly factor BamB
MRAPALAPAPGFAVLCFGLLALVGCGSTTVRRAGQPEREMPAGVVHMVWRTPLHEHGLFEPAPEECASGAVVNRRLVVGTRGGKVVALDVATGQVDWTTAVSGGVDSEARYDQARNQVYVGTDDGTFYAVDPASGQPRWSYRARGSIERMPEVGGDLVFATTASDRVFALEAATGKYRWQYERETPEGFTIHGHSGARLRQGVVYAGFSDGFLVALQASSGDVLWARSLAAASDQFVDVDATPVFHDDVLFTSSYSGGLYALQARNGDVRWRLGIEGASSISLSDTRLYVAAPRDGLAALTPEGQVLWRQGLAEAGDLTPPVNVGPYLIFSGSRAGLFIVDRASGNLLQLFNPGRGMCAPATIAEGGHALYALANSGTLSALQLEY